MATTTRTEARRSIKLDGETFRVKASYNEEEAIAAAKVMRNDRIERAARKAEVEAPASAATSGMIETPAPAEAPAAPKPPKGEWTLLAAFEGVESKTTAPGSKRAKVIAGLKADQNLADLKEIIQRLATSDATALANGAYALNAALSTHYARVA
jgi:hypothetical protein